MTLSSDGAVKGWIDWGALNNIPWVHNYARFDLEAITQDFSTRTGVILKKGSWVN